MKRKWLSRLLGTLGVLATMASAAWSQTIYWTDFDGNNDNWTITKGLWTYGVPKDGPGAPFEGTRCACTTLSGYPPLAESQLISPAIKIPAIPAGQQVVLTFQQWFAWATATDTFHPNPGYGEVLVSTTGVNGPWTSLAFEDWASGSWSMAQIDLSAYAGQTINIAFDHHGGDSGDAGWFVDDLFVLQRPIKTLVLNQEVTFENFTNLNYQGWLVSNGVWAFGAPSDGPGVAYQGKVCAATQLSGGYPARTGSALISPAITLPKLLANNQIVLTFQQWFAWATGTDTFHPDPGYGQVLVSTNGPNGPWTSLSFEDWASGVWSMGQIDLSAYAGKTINFAFYQQGGDSQSSGWYVDNVEVVQRPIVTMPFGVTQNFEHFAPTNYQGWTVTNGVWQFGMPTGGPGAPFDGKECAGTPLSGGYAARTSSLLVSPSVSLPKLIAGDQIVLTYQQWFAWATGTDTFHPDPGYGEVLISTTGPNGPWTSLGSDNWASGSWSMAQIDLSAYAGQTINIAFDQIGGDSSDTGWFIDDVLVSQRPIVVMPWNQGITFANFTETNYHGWTVTNGVWQFGAGSPFSGAPCAATQLNGGYPPRTESKLISPQINLPQLASGKHFRLHLSQYYNFASSTGTFAPDPGYGTIIISTNGPSGPWTALTQNYTYSSGGIFDPNIDLSAFPGRRSASLSICREATLRIPVGLLPTLRSTWSERPLSVGRGLPPYRERSGSWA